MHDEIQVQRRYGLDDGWVLLPWLWMMFITMPSQAVIDLTLYLRDGTG